MDRKELWDSFPPEDQILIKESLATLAALGFFNALAKVELQSVVENSIGREPEDILKEIQRYQAESLVWRVFHAYGLSLTQDSKEGN